MASSESAAGTPATSSAVPIPPGTRHGRAIPGARARSHVKAASSTSRLSEYSQTLRTMSSLNENAAKAA
jgi:hypothetical protein